jgi:hypothetical protein
MNKSTMVVIVMLVAIMAILWHHRQEGFGKCCTKTEPAITARQQVIELDFPHPGNGLLIGKLFY